MGDSSQNISKEIYQKNLKKGILIISSIYAIWIIAWMIEQLLELEFGFLSTETSKFIFWLSAKIFIWIIPGIYLMNISKIKIPLFNLHLLRQAISWGIGIGLILGSITLLIKLLKHQPFIFNSFTLTFLSGVIITPIFEEFLFRGAILMILKQHYGFIKANIFTSILFLGMHLPGWYFQGKLLINLTDTIELSLSIFLLSLVFGYVAKKSGTIIGSILTHILNNFFTIKI